VTCTVAGCAAPAHRRGWCQRHYTRWRRRGAPDAPVRPQVPSAAAQMAAGVQRGTADECWPWTGPRLPSGYGRLRGAGDRYAHRESWAAVHGPIPPGVRIWHRCDWPPCCNVAHLVAGRTPVRAPRYPSPAA